MFAHPESPCDAFDELLEPYLDGELETAENALLTRHLERCAVCGDRLADARRLRSTLAALPARRCPSAISDAALAHARADAERLRAAASRDRDRPCFDAPAGRGRGFWRRLWASPLPRWQPALAFLLLAALGLAYFSRPASIPGPETLEPVADAAEIARAEAEVKLALAYLGRMGARTGTIVRHEVIEERLAPPIARSLSHALLPAMLLAPPPATAPTGDGETL